jgi:hypothetical protein
MTLSDRGLVVVSDQEWPRSARIWGSGGWDPPSEREGRDWLTLFRLLGWGSSIVLPSTLESTAEAPQIAVVACEPDDLRQSQVTRLKRWLEADNLLLITGAPSEELPLAGLTHVTGRAGASSGRSLTWIGPGLPTTWFCRRDLSVVNLSIPEDAVVWTTLDGAPAVVARRTGRGVVATLAFDPSAARDCDGAATALLRHLLVFGPQGPAAWLDFANTMVLRMDDPGGAQNAHKWDWCYPKLDDEAWGAIGRDLARRVARLSIAYTPGWVDDGDPQRGELIVDGRKAERAPGRVHPSPLVVYEDRAGHAPGTRYDYVSEFRGIQRLRGAGLAEVELHGYTHMHPDRIGWARAEDRYVARPWFRELGVNAEEALRRVSPDEHPLSLGMAAIENFFDVRPTTLIPPGDEWTDEVLEHALELGLQLVDSYYLALRHEGRFCWSTHVCSPYLNTAESSWFDAGLPVVGYFHDYELAIEGLQWMKKWLDEWQDAGAKRFIDFRELAAVLGRRVWLEDNGVPTLIVKEAGGPDLVRPLRVAIALPSRALPSEIVVRSQGSEIVVPVVATAGRVGLVEVPTSLSRLPDRTESA